MKYFQIDVEVDEKSPLFKTLDKKQQVLLTHGDSIDKVADNYKVVATSKSGIGKDIEYYSTIEFYRLDLQQKLFPKFDTGFHMYVLDKWISQITNEFDIPFWLFELPALSTI